MAPKIKLTPQQKARAKAKKLKLQAKAAAAAAAAAGAGGEGGAPAGENGASEGGDGAVAVAEKTKGIGSLRKKILEGLAGKTVDEAVAEANAKLKQFEAVIQESDALDKAQAKQADEAQKEFEKAKLEVSAAMEKETVAAAQFKALNAKKAEAHRTVDTKRSELLEAQKKLAMLEVMAMNHARMAELENKRKAATEAADLAKKNLLEQRQKEKDALEATRAALAEARNATKKAKRPADEAEVEAPGSAKKAAVGTNNID